MRPAPFSLVRRVVVAVSFCAASCWLSGCNWLSGRQANTAGKLYYRFGHYTAAATEFHRAAIDDPTNADYLHNLAAARQKQGRLAEAEQVYRRALQVNPGHQPSYHGLASLLKEQHRTGEAVALLRSWVDIEPYRAEPYVELAWLQRETGDYAAAKMTLQQALTSHPRHPTLLAHLGQIYQDTGQHATAAAMYQRSLYSNWYQPQVHSRLAMLRERPRLARAAPPFLGPAIPTAAYPGMMPSVDGRRVSAAESFNADPAHVPSKTAGNNSGTGRQPNDSSLR